MNERVRKEVREISRLFDVLCAIEGCSKTEVMVRALRQYASQLGVGSGPQGVAVAPPTLDPTLAAAPRDRKMTPVTRPGRIPREQRVTTSRRSRTSFPGTTPR